MENLEALISKAEKLGIYWILKMTSFVYEDGRYQCTMALFKNPGEVFETIGSSVVETFTKTLALVEEALAHAHKE